MAPSTLAVALLAHTLFGQTIQGTVKVRDHGPSEGRYDIVFLAEGYTALEQAKFVEDVTTLTDWLFEQPPFDEFGPVVNVSAVKVLSASSGINTPGEARSTAFGAHTNCWAGAPQSVCVDDSIVDKVLAVAAPYADVAVVLLNSETYAGTAGRHALVSLSWRAKFTLAHELGHAIAGLADEYEDFNPYPECPEDDCPEPNVSRLKSRSQVKWAPWIDPSTPIPTPAGSSEVGMFEGARYKAAGLYRPVDNCMMRSGERFCPVCSEALGRSFWRASKLGAASPETWMPVVAGPACSLSFHANAPALPSGRLSFLWTVDGESAGNGPSLNLKTGTLDLGEHEVHVAAQDHSELVRNDPEADLTPGTKWVVQVEEGAACPATGCGCTASPTAPALGMAALGLLAPGRRRRGA